MTILKNPVVRICYQWVAVSYSGSSVAELEVSVY